MATAVEMPKLGNTVESCVLTAWLKDKGDTVRSGEPIAEVETDKASFEVPAPADGVLLDTFFAEGDLVPVFTAICAIGAPGENPAELRPAAATPAGPQVPPAAGEPVPQAGGEPLPAVRPAPAATTGPVRGVALSPRARRFARDHGITSPPAAGRGPGGRVLEADVRDQFYARPRASQPAQDQMTRGYLASGPGSGVGGMIRMRDLAPPEAALPHVRQVIARHMRESLNSTAQYTLNSSANAAGLLAARRRLKSDPATAGITIGTLVAFCTIRALRQVPEVNAEFRDGVLHRHDEVHLGFACDTPRGLMVPVVHASERLSLPGLAGRMAELTGQAVAGTIAPDDLAGGTFTVTNLGGLGIESFTPVLNPPQVAILGVDAIGVKAVRKPDGNIEFIDAIGLSLTLDHQVVDGAPGARFLRLVKEQIEKSGELCTT